MTDTTVNEEMLHEIMQNVLAVWERISKRVVGLPISDLNFQVPIDAVMVSYVTDYEPLSIFVSVHAMRTDRPFMPNYDPDAPKNFFNTDNVTFYYKDEPIDVDFEQGVVGDDTEMPNLFEILNEAAAQDSPNPVFTADMMYAIAQERQGVTEPEAAPVNEEANSPADDTPDSPADNTPDSPEA